MGVGSGTPGPPNTTGGLISPTQTLAFSGLEDNLNEEETEEQDEQDTGVSHKEQQQEMNETYLTGDMTSPSEEVRTQQIKNLPTPKESKVVGDKKEQWEG